MRLSPDSLPGEYASDVDLAANTTPQDSIEHAVTRLLLSTKELLSTLESWSTGKKDRQEVVNANDRLLSHLEKAQSAFEEADISMSDVVQIAQELDEAVASALSEEPPDTLVQESTYLPAIRDLVLELLHMLREKQAARQKQQQQQQSLNTPELPPRSAKRKSAGKTLYLQFGKRVKKVHCITNALQSMDDVRMLFLETFKSEHFPNCSTFVVYIRDPVTLSMHVLRNLQDVVNGSLLVLPIDTSALRAFVEQQLSTLKCLVQQRSSTVSGRIQSDLQQLREDVKGLQKISDDFRSEYQYILTHSVKQITAMQQPPGLKQHQQNLESLAVRICRLQDSVDVITEDIVQRRCRPSSASLRHCATALQALQQDLAKYTTATNQYRAIWRKNWERGLQTVASEQQLLRHCEALVADMRDDCIDIEKVMEHLECIHTSTTTSSPPSAI